MAWVRSAAQAAVPSPASPSPNLRRRHRDRTCASGRDTSAVCVLAAARAAGHRRRRASTQLTSPPKAPTSARDRGTLAVPDRAACVSLQLVAPPSSRRPLPEEASRDALLTGRNQRGIRSALVTAIPEVLHCRRELRARVTARAACPSRSRDDTLRALHGGAEEAFASRVHGFSGVSSTAGDYPSSARLDTKSSRDGLRWLGPPTRSQTVRQQQVGARPICDTHFFTAVVMPSWSSKDGKDNRTERIGSDWGCGFE